MALLQYVFYTTTQTGDAAGIVKFIDGVPTSIISLPYSGGVLLRRCDWSPDGRYVMAGINSGTGVNPARSLYMWKRLDDDTFIEIDLGTAAAYGRSTTVSDVKWVTDTVCLVTYASSGAGGGVFVGVLDRNTDTMTWSKPAGSASTILWQSIAVHPNTNEILLLRSGDFRWFSRSGTTLTETAGSFESAVYGFTWAEFLQDGSGLMAAAYQGSPSTNELQIRRVTGAFTATPSGMIYRNDDLTSRPTFVKFSKRANKGYIIQQNDSTNMLRFVETIPHSGAIRWNVVKPLTGISYGSSASTLSIIYRPHDELILLGVHGGAIVGRSFKGLVFNRNTYSFEEDTKINEFFSSVALYLQFTIASNPIDTGGTAKLYNAGLQGLVEDTVDLVNLKVALVDSDAVFDPAHTTLAQVLGANEVYGSSWPQGGVEIGTGTYSVVNREYQLKISIPDTLLSAAGSLTFRNAVVYDDTDVNKKPIGFISYTADKTVNQNEYVRLWSESNKFATLLALP